MSARGRMRSCEGPSPRGRGSPTGRSSRPAPTRSIPAWAGKPPSSAAAGCRPRVHPRVGGEARLARRGRTFGRGPSPRGRGSRRLVVAHVGGRGSIPAWAGKPGRRAPRAPGRRVHPRVGGEAAAATATPPVEGGPSPRGRGSLGCGSHAHGRWGSIPAWAGKPVASVVGPALPEVHPRVGGEASSVSSLVEEVAGPSPRGRGSLVDGAARVDLTRSIPAWAGKPGFSTGPTTAVTVHPRVGGEATGPDGAAETFAGPSPRGRGSHPRGRVRERHRGSIPAWAGKPPVRDRCTGSRRVHPRVGGEARQRWPSASSASGPSPRGRGSPPRRDSSRLGRGSIPAWAGKPSPSGRTRRPARVHPRVGGEAAAGGDETTLCQGPSPRGRGSLGQGAGRRRDRGSIPAWAGKPKPPP